MSKVLLEDIELSIPGWVTDLTAFRRWVQSVDFPEKQRAFWVGGEVWVDMSREQLFTHVAVKGEFFRVLANLVRDLDLGRMLQDGALYSNPEADISVNPDAVFVSHNAREAERVTLGEGSEGGFVEILGTPDMVLEVVSRSSVNKDTKVLFESYWEVGIPEYWLVDARKSPPKFDLYQHTPDGYVAARRRDGWAKSGVFGRQFRLTTTTDRFGDPAYTVETK